MDRHNAIWSGWFNVESDPEMGNLVEVFRLDNSEMYEFDMFIVWKSAEDGTYYWDWDSGCSCPTPFEGVDSLANLLTGPKSRAVEAATAWVNSKDSWDVHSQQNKIGLKSQIRDFSRSRIPMPDMPTCKNHALAHCSECGL